ncbi:helix-turn-helix domain-containing protein [Cellulomonas gilvus]|uniref:DNA binding domain protein, excisionase family n=1 Tax=Cellulomonas gilvus (strain ATCC 13127 / NRRL B-14078) TaxID=593907 RepID=F8A1B5_CELGA|nr:helix-turn-helix domain-containing protein [Cellulomonas gilvus]AEI11662.1 DNA binding domain protein, excisionase family [Cellulomonas gilvus ATCC 13127]
MPQQYLSLADVAEILGVSVGQVRSMVTTGELEAFQLGGRKIWRVGVEDLDAYVDRQKARTRERIASGASFEEE